MFLPEGVIGVFEVGGEVGRVHDGGILQALAEGGAEIGEAGEIGGEGGGDVEVLVGSRGDEFREAEVGKHAAAEALGIGGAGEGDGGDAHPEGVAGDGVAVDGEGVEEDVELGVGGEVVGEGEFSGEGEAVRGDTVGGEEVEDAGLAERVFKAAGHEGEAGGGEAVEELGPGGEEGGGEFVEHVERGEGDVAVDEGGERGDGRGEFWWAVAGEGAREAVECFGVEVVGHAGGIDEGIGEAEVDGGKAGGAEVAEGGELERCGFPGEEGEAVVGGVTGEVDEDVDAVLADQVGSLRVSERGDVAPVIGRDRGLQACGGRIGAMNVGIAEDLDAVGVVRGEQAFEKEGDGVVAEIGREVGDAENSIFDF